MQDPAAPAPEGSAMSAAVGPQLDIPAGLPRNLEAAIQRYGSATYKAPVATVLDPNGKLSLTLSYGKLLSRSLKIAYTLLNKIGLNNRTGESQVKPGDRVALVYPNSDPLNMICAFYGCLMAGAVPVPIEVPISRRDAGSQQIGFLLGQYCSTAHRVVKVKLMSLSSRNLVSHLFPSYISKPTRPSVLTEFRYLFCWFNSLRLGCLREAAGERNNRLPDSRFYSPATGRNRITSLSSALGCWSVEGIPSPLT